MSLERFAAYAAAFEKAFENDDWSLVEPFFTEDAVYHVTGAPPLGATHEGRAAVLAGFKASVDALDRRFDVREVRLVEGPTQKDGTIWFRWAGTYRRAGLPDFHLEGAETVWFEGDRIRRLEDDISDEMHAQAAAYLVEHGDRLG